MLEAVNNLITNKKIPALEPVQMLALLQYALTLSPRTRITETACRQVQDHPKNFGLFLTNTLLLAQNPMAPAPEVN